MYVLSRPNNSRILELLYLSIEIEHLGDDDIDAYRDAVAVVVEAIPDNAAILSHQLAFGQMTDLLSPHIENVDVHRVTRLVEVVVDEASIVVTVAVGREDIGADGDGIFRRLGSLHHRVGLTRGAEMRLLSGRMPVVGTH